MFHIDFGLIRMNKEIFTEEINRLLQSKYVLSFHNAMIEEQILLNIHDKIMFVRNNQFEKLIDKYAIFDFSNI